MALARATPLADWRADDAQSPLVDVAAGKPVAPDDDN
jgi:hypothetical protein